MLSEIWELRCILQCLCLWSRQSPKYESEFPECIYSFHWCPELWVFCGFENGVHHFISVLILARQCCYDGATSTFGNVVIILYCSLALRCSLVRAACGNNSSAVQNLNEWIFSSAVILNGSRGQRIMVFMSHSTF